MRNYFKGNKNYKYYKSSDKRNLLNSKSKKISSKTAKKNNKNKMEKYIYFNNIIIHYIFIYLYLFHFHFQ